MAIVKSLSNPLGKQSLRRDFVLDKGAIGIKRILIMKFRQSYNIKYTKINIIKNYFKLFKI